MKVKLNYPKLDWYLDNVHPQLLQMTKREVGKTEKKDMAITECLFTFIKQSQKCNQVDEFHFSHWLLYLEVMKNILQKYPKFSFENIQI